MGNEKEEMMMDFALFAQRIAEVLPSWVVIFDPNPVVVFWAGITAITTCNFCFFYRKGRTRWYLMLKFCLLGWSINVVGYFISYGI
jgi:hypothetical protein